MSMDEEIGGLFRQEAAELMASLERGLLDLERAPKDRAIIDAVFRDLHTIKGSGAMFGFAALARFVHEFESVFDNLRQGTHGVDQAVIAVALRSCDHIGRLIEAPEGAEAASAELLDALRHAASGETAAAPPPGWSLVFRLGRQVLRLGGNPRLLLAELAELGATEIRARLAAIPALDALDPQDCCTGWQASLPATVPQTTIEDIFLFYRDDMQFDLQDAASAPDLPAAAQPPAEAPAPPVPAPSDAVPVPDPAVAPPAPVREAPAAAPANTPVAETMRVETGRLDELMDRVGELVIAEARLSALAQRFGDPSLLAVTEDIQRLSSGMRNATMSIRMVPIGSIMGRFRRLMRDLSQTLGKPIAFTTGGEDTELDKTVIELLANPLVHILRNSADHGLESAEARRAAGKPETGSIELAAAYSGAEVLITVRDDGRGLDAEAIRSQAIARNMITADAQLSQSETFRLIFEPGFSTAKKVTELSGRGVGLDVVKRTIETLRGQIDLASEPGKGATVTLRLPLTLAIVDGLQIEVGGENYTFPLAAVEECVELPPEFETEGRSSSFLNIRGGLVPFLRLRTLFAIREPVPPFQKVVIVSAGGQRIGLVVDRIVGNNQTVIKQLSRLHAHLKCFSGATILGDGSVALILDVPQLVSLGRAQEDRLRDQHGERAA
ncbi:chemotaxis protein CheA [Cereibacter changlensis]|uniref:chemotaxis protein CheA n=1 Tax=Cereibacter changlensis TaxID=402884 RepID=UPI004033709C